MLDKGYPEKRQIKEINSFIYLKLRIALSNWNLTQIKLLNNWDYVIKVRHSQSNVIQMNLGPLSGLTDNPCIHKKYSSVCV